MEAARYLPGSTFLFFPVTTHMPSFMGTRPVFFPPVQQPSHKKPVNTSVYGLFPTPRVGLEPTTTRLTAEYSTNGCTRTPKKYEFLCPFFYAASRRINTSEFQGPLWGCLWTIFIKNNWSLSCLRKSSLFILRKSKRFNHFFRHFISIYHNTAPFQNLLQIWQILIS